MLSNTFITILIALNWIGTPNTNIDENKIAWHENQPLTLDDFLGEPILSSRYNAETSLLISYNLGISTHNQEVKIKFTVTCLFDKESSWINPTSSNGRLLQHEQLHFDIAEVYARRLRKKLSETNFTIANYRSKSSTIFKENFKDYERFQIIYDSDTNHGLKQKQQALWRANINRVLKRTSKYKKSKYQVTK